MNRPEMNARLRVGAQLAEIKYDGLPQICIRTYIVTHLMSLSATGHSRTLFRRLRV